MVKNTWEHLPEHAISEAFKELCARVWGDVVCQLYLSSMKPQPELLVLSQAKATILCLL